MVTNCSRIVNRGWAGAVLPAALVAGTVLAALPSPVPPVKTPDRQKAAQAAYARLPLSFEENRGQAGREARYLARGQGYTLLLTGQEAVLQLRSPKSPARRLKADTLRMRLAGARPQPAVRAADPQPGKVHYFVGRDPQQWRTNVPHYGRVQYEDVYPGVDVVYYGAQQQLEYDFIVAPGADPDQIRLQFQGAEQVEVADNGDLVLHTDGGAVRQHKPVVYQEIDGQRQEVAGAYTLLPSEKSATPEIGFELAAYDASRPLVIDPILSYSTYLGGGADDAAYDIAVDDQGSAYVTGDTKSANFPAAGAQAGAGVFVTKLTPDGSGIVYSAYLGGSADDFGRGIDVDSAGHAYVTGNTTSPDFPLANALQGANRGERDVFLTKLSPDGSSLVYSTYLGGVGSDYGLEIAVDAGGSPYLTGLTFSNDYPTTAGSFDTARDGGAARTSDAFVTKVSADGGSLAYSGYIGATGSENMYGGDIAVDAEGNAIVTGTTDSTDLVTVNGFQTVFGGGVYSGSYSDSFVAKVNASGSALVYLTYLGMSGDEYGSGIAVDAAGNAYATGMTWSTDFPLVNPLQARNNGRVDAYVTKFSPSGTVVYSTYLGGSGEDQGTAIDVDRDGNAYVTGKAKSSDFPMLNSVQKGSAGDADLFIAKINAAGSALVYSTCLGGRSRDHAFSLAVDGAGNAYVAGETVSNNFPTAKAARAAYSGGTDAFVVKIDPSGAAAPGPTPGPEPSAQAGKLSVSTTKVSFGTMKVGKPKSKTVQLKNKGTGPLTVDVAALAAPYAVSPAGPVVIAAGQSVNLTVLLSPTAKGAANTTLALTSDDPKLASVKISVTSTVK